MLARIERDPRIESAWVDHDGARLVVYVRPGADPRGTADAARGLLAPSGEARELAGADRDAAVRARESGEGVWARAGDVIEKLSQEEAQALGARAGKYAASEAVGLGPADAAKVEAAVRNACLRAFRTEARHDDYDSRRLHETICEEVDRAYSTLDVPAPAIEKLRARLQELRAVKPACPEPSTSPAPPPRSRP